MQLSHFSYHSKWQFIKEALDYVFCGDAHVVSRFQEVNLFFKKNMGIEIQPEDVECYMHLLWCVQGVSPNMLENLFSYISYMREIYWKEEMDTKQFQALNEMIIASKQQGEYDPSFLGELMARQYFSKITQFFVFFLPHLEKRLWDTQARFFLITKEMMESPDDYSFVYQESFSNYLVHLIRENTEWFYEPEFVSYIQRMMFWMEQEKMHGNVDFRLWISFEIFKKEFQRIQELEEGKKIKVLKSGV